MANITPLCEMTDEEVVLLAQSGDEAALEHIIVRYSGFVNRRAKKFFLVGSEHDDLIQEGMIGLYEAVKAFRVGTTAFRTFAGICIRRQMISAVKKATRDKHKPLNFYVSFDKEEFSGEGESRMLVSNLEKAPQDPESIVIDKESFDGIESTINKTLSKLELEVLMLYLEGYSYRQIAEKIGKQVKTVDNAICRIKRKIENALSN